MKKETRVNWFVIIGCVILAAFLPSVAIAAFGVVGGIWLCVLTLSCLPFIGGKQIELEE